MDLWILAFSGKNGHQKRTFTSLYKSKKIHGFSWIIRIIRGQKSKAAKKPKKKGNLLAIPI